jgi:predicted Holliday junction resolvase-like endonuclease
MSFLIQKVKEMLEEYQKENGTLNEKEYEKLFVHFYLQHEDEYLKKRIKSIRSDGKRRKPHDS